MEKRNGHLPLVAVMPNFGVLIFGFIVYLGTIRAAQAYHRWGLCLEGVENPMDYKSL